MKFLIAIIALFIHFVISAQINSGVDAQQNLRDVGGSSVMSRTFDNRYIGIEGSPFLFSDYVAGSVIFNNGKRIDQIKLNIDAYKGEVIYLPKNSSIGIVLNNDDVAFIELSGNNMERRFAIDSVKAIGRPAVFEFLIDDNSKYFIGHTVELLKANYQGAYSANRNYDEFVKKEIFYIYNGSGIIPFKTNKKFLKLYFPDNYEDILNFLKLNQLNLNDREHIYQLCVYLDKFY